MNSKIGHHKNTVRRRATGSGRVATKREQLADLKKLDDFLRRREVGYTAGRQRFMFGKGKALK